MKPDQTKPNQTEPYNQYLPTHCLEKTENEIYALFTRLRTY